MLGRDQSRATEDLFRASCRTSAPVRTTRLFHEEDAVMAVSFNESRPTMSKLTVGLRTVIFALRFSSDQT